MAKDSHKSSHANTTVYLALHGLFPYRRLGSPFFWVGTLGVGLGVMLLIIVLSVMDGFGSTYRQKMQQLAGDLRVEGVQLIRSPDNLLKKIKADPDVLAASPYGQGFMMIEHDRRPAFPIVRGIDPILEAQTIPYKDAKLIKAGSLEMLDDEGVLLSTLLAQQIDAHVGSTIDIYTPLMISRLQKNEVLLPKTLKVVGIYETGWHDFDANTLILSLPTFQELYGLGDSIHGVTIRLKPGTNLDAVRDRLAPQLQPLMVSTWKDLFKDFLWVLDLERNMMFFLMMFVVLVAAFAMGAAQVMTVFRKTREIGLLMAMGTTNGSVAFVYALQGAVVGFFGVILGNIAALTVLHFSDSILQSIAHLTGTAETLEKFYQFSHLPTTYSLETALIIAAAAIILATLSGLFPALLVTRLKPAEALRNE